MNRVGITLLFLLGTGILLLSGMAAVAREARPPNIVFILSDDLGYADLSCYGAPKIRTPNIDRMAAEGARFTDFYATACVCTPTRASLMTGCYPKRVGLHVAVLERKSKRGLNPNEVTIAKLLRQRGYATACIGKWHLGENPLTLPTHQGFDSYFGMAGPNHGASDLYRDTKVIEEAGKIDLSQLTQRYTKEAIDFIRRSKDKPFFLYLAHGAPHIPLYASEAFKGKSAGGLYGDMIEELDDGVGRVLATIRELGLDEETLVVFTSDNGQWDIAAPPLHGGKGSTWEGGLRVPCVVRWPGVVPAGRVTHDLAIMFDWMPTMARLGGAALPADRKIDGVDIWPDVIGNPAAPAPHPPFVYYSREGLAAAIRSGKWKLHVIVPVEKWAGKLPRKEALLDTKPTTPPPWLYDLEADPGETHDVAAEHPDIVRRLRATLEATDAELTRDARPAFEEKPAATQPTTKPAATRPVEKSPASLRWPFPFQQNLPADYLDRIHASLIAGTARMGRLHLADARSGDAIGWVRYGMPSLILGRRVDEINRFFESEKFAWTTNPKFGFSLFSVSYMRMYALMNGRTGPMQGLLSPKALENFEKGMWTVARSNSTLAEARRGVWDMEGSENHHLSSKSCDFLAAQFVRDIPAYAGQKYNDGSTPAEQYEARRAYFLKWFDERARRGQFVEAGSPSYQGDSLAALFNLRDFAEDPLLRKKADMYLDLTFAAMAEETLLTTRGGPKSRVKVGHEYDGGFCDRSYDLLFNAPGRAFEPLGVGALSTSDYYPPPAIVNLARNTAGRGAYSFTKRWPGPVADGKGHGADDPDGVLWRSLDPERSVLRYGFATPSYVIGSAGLDPRWLDDTSMGNRWQGVVFDGDPLARIGFETKPASARGWHGFNSFFSLQDRNILITRKWALSPPNPPSAQPAHLRVYFSPTLDLVHEEAGWIFVKDGGAFAAVKVVAGGYTWTPAWKHAADLQLGSKAFITLDSEDAPVVLVANQATDYDRNFDAFKAALKAQPLRCEQGIVHFATMTFYGPLSAPGDTQARPGEINGQPLNLAPARGYDSPFIRSEWNSGLIYIRVGNETETLDFRDPDHPVKTIGGPATAEFPPGNGSAQPVIFPAAAR